MSARWLISLYVLCKSKDIKTVVVWIVYRVVWALHSYPIEYIIGGRVIYGPSLSWAELVIGPSTRMGLPKEGLPNQRQEMSGNVRKRQKLNFSIFHDVSVIIMNNSENSIRFFHFILYFDRTLAKSNYRLSVTKYG